MPQISRSALVMFSAQQMYDLVNDVSKYPEFLPNCSNAQIHSHDETEMSASVEISKAGIRKWFSTKNILTSGQAIEMRLLDGPFKKLSGGWRFTVLDEKACKVTLELDFEFTNKLVEMAFGKVFNELANNMVKAFTQRAKQVYSE
jgi:ribosome-associated toxin RatA of RatAB toxin-antitoxin module